MVAGAAVDGRGIHGQDGGKRIRVAGAARRGRVCIYVFGLRRGVRESGWAESPVPFTSCGGRCVRLRLVHSGGGVAVGKRDCSI